MATVLIISLVCGGEAGLGRGLREGFIELTIYVKEINFQVGSLGIF